MPPRRPPDGVSAALATLRVLGQHRLTYIVASDGEELVLVDQHTAHERVRFERLQERAARHAVESQGLLSPAVVEVPPELRPILDAHQQALSELGYDVEPFGRGSSRLRAVPAMLGQKDPGPSLLRILRELCEREASDWTDLDARDRIAATLACHSAVRAGQGLNERTMAAIVEPCARPPTRRCARTGGRRWCASRATSSAAGSGGRAGGGAEGRGAAVCGRVGAEGRDQPAGQRPGPPVADRLLVDLPQRHHLAGGAGQERFVGGQQVFEPQRLSRGPSCRGRAPAPARPRA